jgi:hypothetical protein
MNMILQLYPDERLKKKIRTKNLMPLSRQAGSRGCDYHLNLCRFLK